MGCAARPARAPDTSASRDDPALHPLAGSVAAADSAVEWMHFRVGQPDQAWSRCARVLADAAFFTAWRAQLAAQLGERHAEVPERVPAGYVLQWYLGVPAYLGTMLFHRCRRVPGLHPGRLAFRLHAGCVQAVLLRPGPFSCLPTDPDRDHPDATVVDDEVALAAVLRRGVVEHATRFLDVYGPSVRFGPRTLWGAVTDVLDTGLLLAGRATGDAEAGVADARLVLADRYPPLRTASTVRLLVDGDGREHWTRQRSSCCFCYALPGVSQPCATCPRVDDTERARILGELDC